MSLCWCLKYPCRFCNLQWLRPAWLYERRKLALDLKRLKTPWLKRFGKAGMPFRTTSIQDDTKWRTIQFISLLPCWMLIADGLRVGCSGSRSMSQNCAQHSTWHYGLPQTCSPLDPMKFLKCNNGKLYTVAQVLLDKYQREGDDFLGRIVSMDETWARSYESNLKRQ